MEETMTDKRMTPQEALEIATKYAQRFVDVINRLDGVKFYEGCGVTFDDKDAVTTECATALAVLREHHAYFSRFKPGDTVHVVCRTNSDPREPGWYVVSKEPVDIVFFDREKCMIQQSWDDHDGYDCFPTRAEAEAECERRNKERE